MSVAYAISKWNRERKWRKFLKLFPVSPHTKILDVGFSEIEYSATDNFLEKHYPHQGQITALGIDTAKQFKKRYPKVKAVHYDGKKFPFADKEFDICWSNAVIEHVGDRAAQLRFLKEVARVSKSAFLTTPNRYFPIEVHTRIPLLHFLPKRMFDALLPLFGKRWAAGNYMHLLGIRDIKKLLRKAGIKRYAIIKNNLLFTLDFIIKF